MQRRKRESEPESLHRVLEQTVSGLGLKKKTSQWKVVQIWPSIVGEAVAKLSRPLHVTDGILFVGTPSSSWAQELDFQKPEILRRISLQIGPGLIRDIHFYGTPWKEENKPGEKWTTIELAEEEKQLIEMMAEEIENPKLKPVMLKWLTRLAIRRKRNANG